MGGSPRQAFHAAAMSIKTVLGLVCDPVGGLVEIPCIKRNASGVANAILCADLALGEMWIRDRRIIVDDSYKTACVLKDAGYVFSITKVLAIEIPDKPGSLVRVLDILSENGVNLEYTYAFTSKKEDSAYMIFKVADNEKAIEVLDKEGIKPVCQSEMSELFTR